MFVVTALGSLELRHGDVAASQVMAMSYSGVKARLHGSPTLINAVESTELNSTVERYCLHSYTKVSEAVDFKMVANELCGKVLL